MDIAPALHPLRLSYSDDTPLLLPLRRSHSRYPVQKIASYDYDGKSFLTLTLDLGLGGMKIKTHEHLSEGRHMNCRLVLGQSSILLKGRIVYSQFVPDEQSVSGIQFVEVTDRDQNFLQEYLTRLDQWLQAEGSTLMGKK